MKPIMRTSSADYEILAIGGFTRSLLNAVSTIEIEFIAGEEKLPFYCLDSVEIIDSDTDAVILTGIVDTASDAVSKSDHSLSVSISSLTSHLVQSDALPKQYKNASADLILSEIASDSGVDILFNGESQTIKKFVVEPGEKYFDCIERLARDQQTVIYDDENGGLIIKRFSSAVHTQQKLEFGAPDVLSINPLFDSTVRYREYIFLGQLPGNQTEETQSAGVYIDETVPMQRRLVQQMENPADNAACTKRAEWEARQRYGQSCTLNVSVPTWYKRDGGLWRVGELIDVDYMRANIFGDEFIIEEISGSFNRENGSEMNLLLRPSGAYSFNREIKSIGYL